MNEAQIRSCVHPPRPVESEVLVVWVIIAILCAVVVGLCASLTSARHEIGVLTAKVEACGGLE